MLRSGRALPTRMSASGPLTTFEPTFSPTGHHDVALLAVGVVQQRDARRAVGIVFDGGDGRRNTGFVPLEVDDAQLALVSAAAAPDGQVAAITASADALLRLGQRLVGTVGREVIIDRRRRKPPCRSCRSVSLDCHDSLFASRCWLFAQQLRCRRSSHSVG